jgi:hypothetical protein
MRSIFSHVRRGAVLAAAAFALVGCDQFLTGTQETEPGIDPNNPSVGVAASTAAARLLFTGAQTSLLVLTGSDALRLASLFSQQLEATGAAYEAIQNQYSINESTTNGVFTALYTGGGLVDMRRVQEQARAIGDSTLLGASQVQEALLVGTGADLFGDLPYSQALQGENPALDPQLQVYDAVQALLTQAITNLSRTGPTNVGPGGADLIYGGGYPITPTNAQRQTQRAKWTRLARTLKARFHLHTAEVRPNAYALALAEAEQGIVDPADNYAFTFSGSINEENLSYQFNQVQRTGQIAPGRALLALLQQRQDPRLNTYFPLVSSTGTARELGLDFADPTATQKIATAEENLLIIAEAAYRTGNQGRALSALRAEQEIAGVPQSTGLAGTALLREILTEKYIALFPSIEPWNDYKRTCFPNLTPTASGGRKIPARLFYDALERQTNTSIPQPQDQPARNANDPANATDPFGNACLGQ